MIRLVIVCVCGPLLGLSLGGSPAAAQDRTVRLHAAEPLVASGLMRHILPRFSLKTQVRVELSDSTEDAQMVLGPGGTPLFRGLGETWGLQVLAPDHPGAARLAEWLQSEVGRRTVTGFAPDGAALFGPPAETERAVAEVSLDGDVALGRAVSRQKCTRCHTVDDESRWSGIGSTPSFGVLRSLPDWEQRFAAFYALNPHPAFVIVADVTPPFPKDRPPPIVPVEMSLDEVEAVLAFVAAMAPADLGGPLVHQ